MGNPNGPERRKKPNIVQLDDAPVAVDIIAQSLVDIAKAMREINLGRLNRRAILILIQDRTKVPLAHIELILNNLADLEKIWVKPAKTKDGQ